MGISTGDDAAVYRLTDEIALIQTIDFFPPVVDDPYDYGAIAAANALSDVYAMGGHPVIALNVAAFPDALDKDILGRILKGGADKAVEAGTLIAGGHTIEDPEPKYGLSVTGIVQPGHQIANVGAQPGDALVLTKPLGSGVLTTAHKNGALDDTSLAEIVAIMAELNRNASEAMIEVGVNACTDITGFGLLGHMKGMLDGSGVGASLTLSDIPTMPAAWEMIDRGFVPGGTGRNRLWIEDAVTWHPEITEAGRVMLMDAQTSGGLLIAVSADKRDALIAALQSRNATAAVIGHTTEEQVLNVNP